MVNFSVRYSTFQRRPPKRVFSEPDAWEPPIKRVFKNGYPNPMKPVQVIDPISILHQMGMEEVLERIFLPLDPLTIRNCRKVSRKWGMIVSQIYDSPLPRVVSYHVAHLNRRWEKGLFDRGQLIVGDSGPIDHLTSHGGYIFVAKQTPEAFFIVSFNMELQLSGHLTFKKSEFAAGSIPETCKIRLQMSDNFMLVVFWPFTTRDKASIIMGFRIQDMQLCNAALVTKMLHHAPPDATGCLHCHKPLLGTNVRTNLSVSPTGKLALKIDKMAKENFLGVVYDIWQLSLTLRYGRTEMLTSRFERKEGIASTSRDHMRFWTAENEAMEFFVSCRMSETFPGEIHCYNKGKMLWYHHRFNECPLLIEANPEYAVILWTSGIDNPYTNASGSIYTSLDAVDSLTGKILFSLKHIAKHFRMIFAAKISHERIAMSGFTPIVGANIVVFDMKSGKVIFDASNQGCMGQNGSPFFVLTRAKLLYENRGERIITCDFWKTSD